MLRSGLLLLLLVSALNQLAFGQGTAFTYQGQLSSSGAPAEGVYDFRFRVAVDPFANNYLGSSFLTNGVPVTNGLFTTAMDFGPSIFAGSNLWLEVAVRTNGGGAYTTLAPLQPLTPTPYSIFANTASNLTGTVSAAQLNGALLSANLSGTYTGAVTFNNPANSFSGNGTGLTNVNAATFAGLAPAGFWQASGNAGTSATNGNFVGTTDYQPLELRANGQRGIRVEPMTNNSRYLGLALSNLVNVVNGSGANYVSNSVFGATIGGGGASFGHGPPFGPSFTNIVTDHFGTVGGGYGNIAAGESTVAGGNQNSASGYRSTVAGGFGNASSGGYAFVGGGESNRATNDHATVVGGYKNTAAYVSSTVGGGFRNYASGDFNGGDSATVAGGYQNAAVGNNGVVAGGAENYAQGDNAVICGGWYHTNLALGGFIGGGQYNSIQAGATNATIAGGLSNNAFGQYATVGGGYNNSAYVISATVSGGYQNQAFNDSATVAGGVFNVAGGAGSMVSGIANLANGYAATVSGGKSNNAASTFATIGGGTNNFANGDGSTVGGGYNNATSGSYATVSGGYGNSASGSAATVAGGVQNVAAGLDSFAAGTTAQALHDFSFVWSDGSQPFSSSVPRQFAVQAAGGVQLAADVQLSGGAAYHNLSLSGGNAFGYLYGSYLALSDGVHLGYNWYYDANGTGHPSNAGGQTSRLSVGYGSVGIYISTAINQPPTVQRLLANASGVTVNGTFNNLSDRNAKQDFAPVSPSHILEEVVQLPLSEWSYKEDPKTRHIGPVAQDFYSIFSVGTDDKHIAPIDEGGVALAAIQGLNQRLEDKGRSSEARIEVLEAENARLKARLEKLEQIVLSQSSE